MPRGAPPGQRFGGGRAKGVRNKATIERDLIAAQIAERRMSEAAKHGRKLAVEKMEEYAGLFEGAAAVFRPTTTEEAKTGRDINADGDWEKFGTWMDRAFNALKEVAKYQSPQLRAIAIAPTPQVDVTETRKTFTLTVFEGGRALPPPREGGNGAA